MISSTISPDAYKTTALNPYDPAPSGLPGVGGLGNIGQLLQMLMDNKRKREQDQFRRQRELMEPPKHEYEPQRETWQERMARFQASMAAENALDPSRTMPEFVKDPYGGLVANKEALPQDTKEYLKWIDQSRMLGGGWGFR